MAGYLLFDVLVYAVSYLVEKIHDWLRMYAKQNNEHSKYEKR